MKKVIVLIFLCLCASVGMATTARCSSGNQQDVQNAINDAPAGGVVEIPNGTFTWTGTLTINKSVHLKGQSKGGVKISAPDARVDVIAITEPASGNAEISDLDFDFVKATDVFPFAIRVRPSSPRGNGRFLLHDCNFHTNYAYAIEWGTNGGLCWNCAFTGGGNLTGISFVVHINTEWTKPSTLGVLDVSGLANTYVEDCNFIGVGSGICNFDDNSRVVMRHCLLDNASIGSHGQETSPEGARQWEIYDNRFICDSQNAHNLQEFFSDRGGTGIITDNDFEDIPYNKSKIALRVFSIRRSGIQIPCQTQYPAARQVGQGWKGEGGYSYPSVPRDGTGYFTDPICIWNNTGAGSKVSNFVVASDYNPDECGNGQLIANYVKLGRDYKLEAKSGYQKYPYPHPLRTGMEPGPTPTPGPTATPEPTSSPTPTPSPTPKPPVQTWEKWIENLNNWIRANPPVSDQAQ